MSRSWIRLIRRRVRPFALPASITSTELKLSDGEQIYTLPLGDKLLLFAPYEWRTHPLKPNHVFRPSGECRTNRSLCATDSKGAVSYKRDAKLSKRDLSVFGQFQYGRTPEVSYNGKRRHTPLPPEMTARSV
ncbi:hypothetical protein KCP76_08580 [Salmonella enterica subsp. enterica serovar Weltevreden]|nr:hypothetical protein KCP76_08580 [Salmonella enterica subsp. enterica serovar Weltevreden]